MVWIGYLTSIFFWFNLVNSGWERNRNGFGTKRKTFYEVNPLIFVLSSPLHTHPNPHFLLYFICHIAQNLFNLEDHNLFETEMRNYKFRLSAVIPSEWFHKLKNMTKPRKKHPLPSYSLNTTNKKKKPTSESKSLPRSYFSNRSHTSLESKTLQISPRNSLHKIQSKRKTVYKPSSPSSSSLSTDLNKNKIKFVRNQDSSATSSNLKFSSSADDIIIDMNNRDFKKKAFKEIKAFDATEKACSASKRTKESRKSHHLSVKVKSKEIEDEEEDACRIKRKHQKPLVSSGRRSSSANSPRIKLRVSSPKIQVSPRRSKPRSQSRQVLDSFAVIKSSFDPMKDFRESMVEMIAENNIIASKDLEDLLACYLALNPKEYHDLIIKVFVQVWLQLINSTFVFK